MSQLCSLGPVLEVYLNGESKTLGEITSGKRWRLIGGVLSAGSAGATFQIESSSGIDARPIVGPLKLAADQSLVLNTSDIGYGTGDIGMKMHALLSAGAVYGTLLVQRID